MTILIKNRYRVENLIGQGGMGAVYKAYDRLMSHAVALKQVTVPQKPIDIETHASETNHQKMVLANEFHTLSSLRHPNIISVLDYGFDDEGNPFFTMDLLDDGVQIREYALDKTPEQKLDYLLGILQALRYLHQRGILHRDLKPANILVTEDSPKLLDFGLAMDTNYAQDPDGAAGTLAYLAPEVLRGQSPSIASDLYAFGVLAYEIFTNDHPFPYETQSELIHQVLLEAPRFIASKLDDALGSVILRLLSKDAEDRYANALDTMRALCNARDYPLPTETVEIRDSFLLASTFVGRETELEKLKNALTQTLNQTGQAWLIAGESGVGKTRLMDELRAQALVKGVTVIRGQAVTEAGLPYKLWRDVLPELLLFADIADDEAAILAKLVPNIGNLLERDIVPTQLAETAIQARLPLLISNLIVEASKKAPLLIMLEDLQWATDSIDILKTIISGITQSSVMIVGNYRSDEAPNLASDLEAMNYLLLERLTEENIRQLSTAMLGESGESYGVVELINRESEGNAFFIVEVVRALAEEVGHLSNIGLATLPAQIFSGGIQKIVERRMAKLPLWALHPVQVSSIIGRQINAELIQVILPDLNVEKWLTVCGEVAIFSAIGEDWQFTHDKIREYALGILEDTQTQSINLQVAEAIENLHADDIEQYAPVLAGYYRAAGNIQKEGFYATKAIEVLRYFVPTEAHYFAKRALELEAHLYHDKPEHEWARLNMLFGKTAMQVAQFDLSRQALDISRAAYEDLDDEFGAAMAKNLIGELGFKTGQYNEAIELLKESLVVLEKYENWLEIGHVYMNLSIIYAQQGDMETALPFFEQCKDAMLKTDDEVSISKAYNNLGIAYETMGDLDKGIETHNKALEIRNHLKDKHGLVSSLTNLAGIEDNKGNYEKSIAMLLEALAYIREINGRRSETFVLSSLAQSEDNLGNRTKAISYLQEALQIAINNKDILQQGNIFSALGDLYVEDNQQQARQYFFDALENIKERDVIPNKVGIIDRLSKLLSELGEASDEEQISWLAATTAYRKNYDNFDTIEAQLEQLKNVMPALEYDIAYQRGQAYELNDVLDLIAEKRENKHDK